jgi:hypothetical protein
VKFNDDGARAAESRLDKVTASVVLEYVLENELKVGESAGMGVKPFTGILGRQFFIKELLNGAIRSILATIEDARETELKRLKTEGAGLLGMAAGDPFKVPRHIGPGLG